MIGCRDDAAFPRFLEAFFNDFFVFIELFVHFFCFHLVLESVGIVGLGVVVDGFALEFSEVDLDFGGTEVSVMVVFSDFGGEFGVLESEEGKFSGFALVVFGDFTVGDLIGEGLEVLLDLFLREVFGDVLDDDSAHGWFDNTFLL